ncbi:MAG: siphovirus Gp157 family protein [Oliverpabstia sp.]
MSSLYELTGQYLALMDIAEEADPDVLRDTLELIDGEIEDKADNYAKVIKNLEGESKTIEEEIERLNRKKKGIDNSIDSIKKNLERCMNVTGKRKFKTTLFSFGIQKNTPSVNVKDESKVPAQFWKKQDPKLDRTSLKEFLKKNGNTDYAELVQGESLRIR